MKNACTPAPAAAACMASRRVAWRAWTERPHLLAAAQPGGEREIDLLWRDRRLGFQQQSLTREVGDFVLKRADGLWAYQLAVVVDDAHQGVTDVVRGEDMADNTARQIHLQRLLGLPTPRYLHTPLVLAADGQKLSKQTGAQALETREPLPALRQAAAVLGLPELQAPTLAEWLAKAIGAWAKHWPRRPTAASGMMRGPGPEPGPNPRPSIEMKRPRMTTTPSGLQYVDTVPGHGDTATAGQRVTVHYTGWLHDSAAPNSRGAKFDSSKDRGDPFKFVLDARHGDRWLGRRRAGHEGGRHPRADHPARAGLWRPAAPAA